MRWRGKYGQQPDLPKVRSESRNRHWPPVFPDPDNDRPRRFETTDARIHPETGKAPRRDVRPQTIRAGSISRAVDVPGWCRDDENLCIHSGADLETSDAVFQDLRNAFGEQRRAARADRPAER